ncbi:PREDICTED: putative phosphatidylglycerol/phosphatidylinositol transfer protein DDB_G0282107 [Amphimedon queenslandica]|uniref:MD-2-related lipid-recognition domain-containing protein n=2 Tax=Amphimedon queenslandica TaxID=400682 RepID=A0AAN0IYX5_AMPQE|nr:PREDICTED: putative phosphatidylglycerol/phosphatidylinositol transfer protein DDB_G0282107 [Amphimedon queenslandica]|eukprot:XP_019849975.1 PREDICTED: putative phosphatidylglycerol/phosphatidylinositol transfer protein DDB_G0282107 [Amphimedon queenslandica]
MMMRSIISLLLVSLLSALSLTRDAQKEENKFNAIHWSYCSNYTGRYFKINYIDTTYVYNTKYNNTDVKMNIDIYETISYATIHFIVKYNFHDTFNVTLIDEYFNFCDMWVDIVKEHCPIKPGNYNMSKSLNPPPMFPKGQYYGKIVTFNEKGQDFACILLDMKDTKQQD